MRDIEIHYNPYKMKTTMRMLNMHTMYRKLEI